ncbi:MAG: flavodoxin family protein [Candidatus Hydrogenedentota bacterium]
MKFVTVMGSPREDGNTANVLAWMEEELRTQGHDVDHIDIMDCRVAYCDGCFRCQNTDDGPGCIQDDDANVIFKRMIEADGVVFASPLYCWGFAAPMKALLDRGVCLIKRPSSENAVYLLAGKRAGLVVTAGGPEEGNADLIVETFRRYTEYLRCAPKGHLVVPYCVQNVELGSNVRVQARDLAHDLVE